MFSGASNFVEGVDIAFVLILGISAFFLIGLTALMLYFTWKYNKKRNPVATQIHGNNTLEVVWTVIPTILVLVMFWYGYKGWKPMMTPPDDAMEVTAVARMWSWSFEYQNGKTSTTLKLPVDEPVKLNLKAVDVIHSLFIPAFRVKQDMVPNKPDNFMWFTPQKAGIYDLFCTEYCGIRHSYMYTDVEVMSREDFDTWYNDSTDMLLLADTNADPAVVAAMMGKQLVENKGCIACHSLDGSKLVGPSFQGIYGKSETVVTNGKERGITVDDEYIRHSILKPNDDIVKGYASGQMQSYEGQLNNEEIDKIIAFLKTLGN